MDGFVIESRNADEPQWMNQVRSLARMIGIPLFVTLGVLLPEMWPKGQSHVAPASTVQTLTIESEILKGNPMHDSTSRKMAVFLSKGYSPDKQLPVVFYLPGFGGGPDDFLQGPGFWLEFVDKLAASVGPLAFVVVDGKNRFGCSQYIDSPASGNYAQYICKEVVPFVERQLHVGGTASRRIIAGHSSGGFGALRLGMAYQEIFGHVVALSPDSDFELSHKPFTVNADTKKLSLSRFREFLPPTLAPISQQDGDIGYAIALCACYASDPAGPLGAFKWFYDANGVYQEDTWKMWLHNDPLYIVTHTMNPFSHRQSVYCEGPDHDDFQANIGAKLIYQALSKSDVRTTFYEPPGHHGDHLPERILRGVSWSLRAPTVDIQ